jgi:uncharacterized protein (TIGR03437 family)
MWLRDTILRRIGKAVPFWSLLLGAFVHVQAQEWQPIGSTTIKAETPDAATGPIKQVFRAGDEVVVISASGAAFRRSGEAWSKIESSATKAQEVNDLVVTPIGKIPEADAKVFRHPAIPGRLFALGKNVHRSDDGGIHWSNVTGFSAANVSILGGRAFWMSFRLENPDDLLLASETGLWRTFDSGASWVADHGNLPALRISRILQVPEAGKEARVEMESGTRRQEFVWFSGERDSWTPVREITTLSVGDEVLERQEIRDDQRYAKTRSGKLFYSLNGGSAWAESLLAGVVSGFAVSRDDARVAWAVVNRQEKGSLFRSIDGGQSWQDVSGDLPVARYSAVTIDGETNTLFVAGERGIYWASANQPQWNRLAGNLPEGSIRDIRLDSQANRVFVAVDGYGLFATLAPHWNSKTKLVNTGDGSDHALAPGALVSVLGSRIFAAQTESAEKGLQSCTILTTNDRESQIQLPLDIKVGAQLRIDSARGVFTGRVMQTVAPAIFVSTDGSPLILDEAGNLVDSRNPAGRQSKVQILASGLGEVAGTDNAVLAPIEVMVNGQSLRVVRATLAANLAGTYMVEVELPEVVNAGPAEISVSASGIASKVTRIWLDSGVR